ncbi:MAG: hypothetical protein M3209_09465 [Acidobacteriota bacterium]|nr:hypothetical protein [Acidobacteriota bacterium]
MAQSNDKWFEIWFHDGSEVIPCYLLIVSPDEKGNVVVIDPLKNNEIAFRGKDYEEVCSWLWEDEFDLAEGRVFPDDGY